MASAAALGKYMRGMESAEWNEEEEVSWPVGQSVREALDVTPSICSAEPLGFGLSWTRRQNDISRIRSIKY